MSRLGERRSKGLSPSGFRARSWALSSQARGSPHRCSPQEAHEQTGGLGKCTCCVSGDLSLGHPRVPQWLHLTGPVVSWGAFSPR